MKFSRRKKAKIRKYNQRKINRYCSHMIGCRIEYRMDFPQGYEVKDQAKLKDVFYLLVEIEDGNYAIYKVVKPFEYVRLSAKRVRQNIEQFSNHENWKMHSTIEISTYGEIKSVKLGTWNGPYNMQRKQFHKVIIGIATT